jgi:hypothetical protein
MWKDYPLIDSPFQTVFENEAAADKTYEVYGSNIVLNADTRWIMDVQVESSAQDAATGIVLRGYGENDDTPNLQLVYKRGCWTIGYSPDGSDAGVIYWEAFRSLTSPAQHFELFIPGDGKSFTLETDNGFQVSRALDGALFDGAQSVVAEIKVGSQSKISLSKLITQQLQNNPVTILSNTVINSPSPTARASASNTEPEYVFYVAVNGDDTNPGTAELPFASIERARDVIRTISPAMKGPILVYVHGGVYPVSETIQFGVMDSGQNGFDIIYRAAEGETPVFSGGVPVTGWEQAPDSKLWKTTLTDVKDFRQIYVNGMRAQRAVSQEPVKGFGWAASSSTQRDGVVIESSSLPDFSRPQDLELHWIYNWMDIRLLVENVENNADDTKTILPKQPYFSHVLWTETWGILPTPLYESPFYLENALELLDEPGEWYYNPDTRELFYLPRQGEDMNTAEVMIPQTESLIEVTGEAVGREAHNIAFEGLTFAYAGWTRTSEMGAFASQAQHLIERDGFGNYHRMMTPAHVQLNSAHDIRFEGCRFEHLGAVGLNMTNNVFQTTVQGNLFHDISDAAIVVGHWEHAYITAPSIQAAPHDNLVANNWIRNVGVEYWGAPAVTVYYANNLRVVHNEISDVPYTGISLGWGWSSTPDSTTSHDNLVANNLITNVLQRARDGGGIYTLGPQPGTVIEGNAIREVKRDHACLYPDEGSAFLTFRNNVCDSAPLWLLVWIDSIHDIQVLNSFTNVETLINNGINVQIENTVAIDGQNWTMEAQSIIDDAGLESDYSHVKDWLPIENLDLP